MYIQIKQEWKLNTLYQPANVHCNKNNKFSNLIKTVKVMNAAIVFSLRPVGTVKHLS